MILRKALAEGDRINSLFWHCYSKMLCFGIFLCWFLALSGGDNAVSFPEDTTTNGSAQSRFGLGFLGKHPALEAILDGQFGAPTQTESTPTTAPFTLFPPLPTISAPLPALSFFNVQPPSPVSLSSRPPTSVAAGVVTPADSFPTTSVSDSGSIAVEPTRCECMPVGLCVNQTTRADVTTRIVTRPPSGMECAPGEVYCCVEYTRIGCGIPNIVPGVLPKEGQANLGEFPWSAVILTNDDAYVGGGILIDTTHVVTAAHKVARYGYIKNFCFVIALSFVSDPSILRHTPENFTSPSEAAAQRNGAELKVRLGDWDLSNENEPVGFLEVGISRIVNHPRFEATTLKNDISLITLASPVSPLTRPYPQINTLCLPEPTAIFTGSRCKVAGWGKDQFNGQYQNIIKKVEVPVLSSIDCQTKLRNTRLGSSFVLDTNSFICAGGEASRDACTGDGGTALACLRNGQYYLVGITAGGIECGIANIPGLYVNVVNYLTWVYAQIGGNGGSTGAIDPRMRA